MFPDITPNELCGVTCDVYLAAASVLLIKEFIMMNMTGKRHTNAVNAMMKSLVLNNNFLKKMLLRPDA